MDKGENQGFSLVELLVAVAILSIVLLVVTTAMVTGSKNFTRGNADANMQREAQLVLNQIEDMIIDSNAGISYAVGSDSRELVLYNVSEVSGSATYTEEVIRWNDADDKLTYSMWDVTYDAVTQKYVRNAAVYNNELLAQDISDFSVDLSDEEKEQEGGSEITVIKSVKVSIGCIGNGGQVTYATSAVIALRNRMLLVER